MLYFCRLLYTLFCIGQLQFALSSLVTLQLSLSIHRKGLDLLILRLILSFKADFKLARQLVGKQGYLLSITNIHFHTNWDKTDCSRSDVFQVPLYSAKLFNLLVNSMTLNCVP